jgi:predicted permease
MRIPLLAGRDFTDQDDSGAPMVAIVNEAFARRFWPGQDPLGRRFNVNGTWRMVIGLAKQGKYNRLSEDAWCFFYLPYQQGVPDLDLNFCVRTQGDPTAFANTLRQTMREIDPGVELLQTLPLTVHSGMVLFPQRMASSVLVLLGLIALVLSAMGVYAVMAYSVSQRIQEFGLRIALGASPRDVLRLVIRGALGLILKGAAAGLGVAFVVTRLMAGFLYGVSPFDPLTFIAVPSFLALVALLACYVPARRAIRVDPMVALRSE